MKVVRPTAVTDAVLTSSNVTEPTGDVWAIGTSYALGAVVRRHSTDLHQLFESAVAANVGHDPLTDNGTNWILLGSTNRWRMFDSLVQSQTMRTDSVDVVLAPPGRVDTLALLNVSATSAQVIMTDALEGEVYNQTRALVSTSGITDWYAYFFEPIERLADIIFEDLPPYSDPSIEVLITEAGQTVAVGALVVGFSKYVGGTQYGANLGIQDYSVKQKDDFGNFVIVPRAFSRKASFAVWVDNEDVDQVMKMLSDYRATATLYLGTTRFGSAAVYGFYRDYGIAISYPDVSVLSIELESVT